MIGMRKLGKLNSEKFCSERLQKIRQKKQQVRKSQTRQKMTQIQRRTTKWLKQPELKILMGIKHPPTKLPHLIWTSGRQ